MLEAHFWGESSHGSVEYDENTIDEAQIQAQAEDLPAFRERVLDFIGGVRPTGRVPNSGDYAEPEEDEARGELVGEYEDPIGDPPTQSLYNQEGDNTQAFIMTPTVDVGATGGPALCGSRITELEDLLRTRFNARVTTYTYAALEYLFDAEAGTFTGQDADVAGEDERGNALFQFDPDSDRQGGRAWRLFYEAAVCSGSVADAE